MKTNSAGPRRSQRASKPTKPRSTDSELESSTLSRKSSDKVRRKRKQDTSDTATKYQQVGETQDDPTNTKDDFDSLLDAVNELDEKHNELDEKSLLSSSTSSSSSSSTCSSSSSTSSTTSNSSSSTPSSLASSPTTPSSSMSRKQRRRVKAQDSLSRYTLDSDDEPSDSVDQRNWSISI